MLSLNVIPDFCAYINCRYTSELNNRMNFRFFKLDKTNFYTIGGIFNESQNTVGFSGK